MIKNQTLEEIIKEQPDIPFVILDGLDNAVLGLNTTKNSLQYSMKGILQSLCDKDGMDYMEALEFYYANIEPLMHLVNGPEFIDDWDDLSQAAGF